MSTEDLAIDPTDYTFAELWNDEDHQARSGALQVSGRTGNRWLLDLVFAGKTDTERRQLLGFMSLLRGKRNRIKFFIPGYTLGGAGGGTPLLNASVSAGATSITVDGLPLSATGVYLAGDWLTLGNELKQICSNVDSDGSGEATIQIWPETHGAHANNDAVEVDDPYGIFFQRQAAPRPRPADQYQATFRMTLEEDVTA